MRRYILFLAFVLMLAVPGTAYAEDDSTIDSNTLAGSFYVDGFDGKEYHIPYVDDPNEYRVYFMFETQDELCLLILTLPEDIIQENVFFNQYPKVAKIGIDDSIANGVIHACYYRQDSIWEYDGSYSSMVTMVHDSDSRLIWSNYRYPVTSSDEQLVYDPSWQDDPPVDESGDAASTAELLESIAESCANMVGLNTILCGGILSMLMLSFTFMRMRH